MSAVETLRQAALALAEKRHVLSGLNGDIEPMMRTVTASPALIARLRAFAYEIETALAAELRTDTTFSGDSTLTAARSVPHTGRCRRDGPTPTRRTTSPRRTASA